MGKVRPTGQLYFNWTSTDTSVSVSSADDIHFEIFIVSNCVLVNNTCKIIFQASQLEDAVRIIFNL
jgi:hypothetical protein